MWHGGSRDVCGVRLKGFGILFALRSHLNEAHSCCGIDPGVEHCPHTIVGSCTIDHCIMVAFGVREHVRSNVQAPVQHLSLFELSSSSSKCCKLYRAQTFILSRDSIVWFKVQRFQREFCLSGATLRLRSSLWLLSIRTL